MFKRNKQQTVVKQVPKPKPTLDWIKSEKTVRGAISSFKMYHPSSLINLTSNSVELVLKEKVEKRYGTPIRTDFIILPQHAINETGKDEFEIDIDYVERLDDIITKYISLNNAYLDNETYPTFFNKSSKIKRVILNSGWEIYRLRDLPLIEVKSEACDKCNSCNERVRTWGYSSGRRIPEYSSSDAPPLNETRTFVIHPAIQEIFGRSKMALVSIEHPCRHLPLNSIIDSDKYVRSLDPPELKIILPQNHNLLTK